MSWPKSRSCTHLSLEEARKVYDKTYLTKHKERIKVSKLKYYYRHKDEPDFVEKQSILHKKYYCNNVEKEKARAKRNTHSRRLAGELTKELMQRVYEDNIKFFGTLTCVYCQKVIPFGDDVIEHRVPISKGGLTVYSNLVIACARCNKSKRDKTWKEFFYRDWEKEGEWI